MDPESALDRDDFCEDSDLVYRADEAEVMSHPSRVLRRIFRSEDHPRGELTDFIPSKRRRRFLIGMLAGASEESPGDFWLNLSRRADGLACAADAVPARALRRRPRVPRQVA